MILIVQQIELKWDKSSRGGTRAQARALTPSQLRVPASTGDVVHHHVLYQGYRAQEPPFRDPVVRVKESSLSENGARLGVYRFVRYSEELQVRLDGHVWRAPTRAGLPSRPTRRGSQLLALTPGTWVAIVDNERSPGWEHTGYKQIHTNVAWLASFEEDIFVASEPTVVLDWRSNLW